MSCKTKTNLLRVHSMLVCVQKITRIIGISAFWIQQIIDQALKVLLILRLLEQLHFDKLCPPILVLHDTLMARQFPAELATLLATCELNDTAMGMTIATLKRHKVAVLPAVTSPYSNGPIEGVNRLIKSLK